MSGMPQRATTIKGILLACGHTIYRSCARPDTTLGAPCDRGDGIQGVLRYYDTGRIRPPRKPIRAVIGR